MAVVVRWSATTETTELVAFPGAESSIALAASSTELFALVYDSGAEVARVYHWVPGDVPTQFGVDLSVPVSPVNGDIASIIKLVVTADGATVYIAGAKLINSGLSISHAVLISGTGGAWSIVDPDVLTPASSSGATGLGLVGAVPMLLCRIGTTLYIFNGSAKVYTDTVTAPTAGHAAGTVTLGVALVWNGAFETLALVTTDGTVYTLDENLTTAFGVDSPLDGVWVTTAEDVYVSATASGNPLLLRRRAGVWTVILAAGAQPLALLVAQAES